jgi:hypothetical protein
MVHNEAMFSILDDFSRMSVFYAQLRKHECSVFIPLTAASDYTIIVPTKCTSFYY